MSLIDRVKKILREAPERTPDNPSGLDFEGQSKKFVKNERDKKKTMRKLEPKGPKQGELNLGNTKTTNTPLSTKRTLKGRPLGSKTKSKGETYKQLTTGGERQKQRKIIKKEFKKQQPISDLKKAKKYAKGEYPRIDGGGLKPDIKKPVKGTTPVKVNVKKPINVDKIFSGTGNVKKGGNVPDKNINPKSKGTTPVKTNVSKLNVDKVFDKPKSSINKTLGVKQSEVSKQAKEFTAKVNKRRAQRIKSATGGKKTGSLRKGNLSFPGDRSGAYQSTKSDIETKKLLKKAGASGDVSPTAGSKIRKKVETVRKTRADKLGTPDPFSIDTSKAAKENQKIFKNIGKPKGKIYKKIDTPIYRKIKTGSSIPDPFKSSTPTGSAIKDFKFQPRDITTSQAEKKASKSFAQFNKDLKKAGANIDIEKKVQNPGYNIKSKGSGASTGSGPDFSSTSSRTGSMKGGSSNTTGGSSTGGGSNKPPKPPKGSGGSMVPPDDSINPEVVKGKFKEKGKGKSGGSGNMSNKQFKKFRKDQKKMFKKFMKQSKKASKQTVTPPVKNVGKFRRFATRVGGKTRLGKVVRGLGVLAAIHYGDNAIRGQAPVQKNKTERIGKPINPETNKQYKSFVDIPRGGRTKTDKEISSYGNKSFSKSVVDQTAKGGRYNPTGQNINLKKYTQSDTYKNVLKQIQKKNKNPNLDPYGVMGNKK